MFGLEAHTWQLVGGLGLTDNIGPDTPTGGAVSLTIMVVAKQQEKRTKSWCGAGTVAGMPVNGMMKAIQIHMEVSLAISVNTGFELLNDSRISLFLIGLYYYSTFIGNK